jgi:hypothetical protein
MPVPNTFANATTSIPLSQLDQNFATAITLGNTAIQLGNTVTTLNNMTLANVTVSSGNVTVTSLSGAFNGTVGATTPNTGAFTNISANNNITFSNKGTLFASGQVGFSYRDVNTALYLQMPTGGLVITDSSLNTKAEFYTAGASTGLAVTGTLSATGQFSASNAVLGIRNNITSTDRISVAGATTIFSIATGGSSVGASGAVILVNGYNTASSTNSFIDLVLFIGSNTPTVLGSVNRGSPAARTYTASGNNLQLAMASGTYNVSSSSTEQAC